MSRAHSLTSAILFSVGVSIAGAACDQNAALRVDKIEPSQGILGGGERITITGAGFEPGKTQVEVRFGRRKADQVTINSPNELTVVSPAGEKGPVNVTLMFDNGKRFQLADGFRYISPQQTTDVRKAFFSEQGPATAPVKK